MRKLMIVPVFAAIALGGCGAPSGNDAAGANAALTPEPANAVGNELASENITARVLAMGDRERNVVFVRALMDAGLPCDGVTSSERLPDQDGKPLWRANCKAPGGSHMIGITPDGTAQIVSRTDR